MSPSQPDDDTVLLYSGKYYEAEGRRYIRVDIAFGSTTSSFLVFTKKDDDFHFAIRPKPSSIDLRIVTEALLP